MRYIRSLMNLKYVFKFFKDIEVPLYKKAVMLFGILYFILPFDVVPEVVFPGVGILDDFAVIVAILTYFNEYFNKYKYKVKDNKETKNKYVNNVEYKINDK